MLLILSDPVFGGCWVSGGVVGCDTVEELREFYGQSRGLSGRRELGRGFSAAGGMLRGLGGRDWRQEVVRCRRTYYGWRCGR